MNKPLGPLLFALAAAFASAEPALTVYNQNFVVVRETVGLNLQPGLNSVSCSGVTLHLEPDSVVLRDPTGHVKFRVLEQNYRADTVSVGLMLALNEGKTIDFLARDRDGKESLVKGRIVRSGYVPNEEISQPIIEVNGQVRFSLPGEPLFPPLADDTVLKPMLVWLIDSPSSISFDAELSYVSRGMSWSASYNLIAPEKGDTLDIVGWITVENQTGKLFENATVKLMAGNVNKLEPVVAYRAAAMGGMKSRAESDVVREKSFDEYHLYSLPRPVTLHDRETKQVEFIRVSGVKAQTVYVYDGAAISPQDRGWPVESIRNNRAYGTTANTKIAVMREFENSEKNGLGIPLPQGRTRFYRRDDADGRLEFTGENFVEHTPKNETVRIYTGDAFDLVGERTSTSYSGSSKVSDSVDESFEIRLRNHKAEPVEIRVVEHLYRGSNWEIVEKSQDFTKADAQTIEFRVSVPANGESIVKYKAHYSAK